LAAIGTDVVSMADIVDINGRYWLYWY